MVAKEKKRRSPQTLYFFSQGHPVTCRLHKSPVVNTFLLSWWIQDKIETPHVDQVVFSYFSYKLGKTQYKMQSACAQSDCRPGTWLSYRLGAKFRLLAMNKKQTENKDCFQICDNMSFYSLPRVMQSLLFCNFCTFLQVVIILVLYWNRPHKV